MSIIKERILQFLKHVKKGQTKFEEQVGLSRGTINNIKSGISTTTLNKISSAYPILNTVWLLTGEGNMLKENSTSSDTKYEKPDFSESKSVPYWNLLVSAGQKLIDVIGKHNPDGYIVGLPGADLAENILPVNGNSMEPEISNGALIGVRKMNNWETLNTERIYLIITQEDRMIKRIEYDHSDEAILWCVSPNYPKFKILKGDIIDIQRVCFVYNPK